MEKTRINDLGKPYYIGKAYLEGGGYSETIFAIPRYTELIKLKDGSQTWIYGGDNPQKLILGENIIEKQLDNLSIIIKETRGENKIGLDAIEQLRKYANLLEYDYFSFKLVEGWAFDCLTDNLWRVYPRLFKLAQSESSSNSLVERVWDIEIPKIGEIPKRGKRK